MISHRDLVRTFERLFRRAELKLSMSEGFHPKARMSFPSALALGIEALDEVMEFELAEEIPAAQLLERLQALAPAGLTITDLQPMEIGQPKPRIHRLTYQFPIPDDRKDATRRAVDTLLSETFRFIERAGRKQPLDVRAGIADLQLDDGVLIMKLKVSREASVRPLEVLEALGLAELQYQGLYLTRTTVELTA